jgi:uncharacterized protein
MQEFEWDSEKAEANRKKHGVSFLAAALVFSDPFRIWIADDRFDYDETREITIGQVQDRVVVVVHTEREDKIRIISARYAEPNEVRAYYERHP